MHGWGQQQKTEASPLIQEYLSLIVKGERMQREQTTRKQKV
jgi:hypothetical protein